MLSEKQLLALKKSAKVFLRKEWWDILKSVIALAIAGPTLFLLIQANILVGTSNEIHRTEISPHFRIIETVERSGNEEYHYSKNSVLHIRHYEGNFYAFSSTIRTYIPLSIGNDRYMIPLAGFYRVGIRHLSGDTVITYSNDGNQSKVANIIIEANRMLRDSNVSGSFGLATTYVQIEFQNTFGEFETRYFIASNSERIDNEIGEWYVNNFSASYYFNGETHFFDIDNITADLLYLFATTDRRNSFPARLFN